jgi:hypothetical protein
MPIAIAVLLTRFFIMVSQLTNTIFPLDWRRIGGRFTMAWCVVSSLVWDLSWIFIIRVTIVRRKSHGTALSFMPPVIAVTVAVVAFYASVITVKLRTPP